MPATTEAPAQEAKQSITVWDGLPSRDERAKLTERKLVERRKRSKTTGTVSSIFAEPPGEDDKLGGFTAECEHGKSKGPFGSFNEALTIAKNPTFCAKCRAAGKAKEEAATA